MNRIIFFVLFLFGTLHIDAQGLKCGHTLLEHSLSEKNPALLKQMEATFNYAKQHISKSNNVLTIPVVVHIVYNNDDQNLSDEVVFDQIEVLNRDFNRMNADTSNLRSIFDDIAGNPMIQFELAGIDPFGNATSGINRVQTDITSFAQIDLLALFDALTECGIDLTAADITDEQLECMLDILGEGIDLDGMKFSASGGVEPWDVERYMNIWVCNMSADLAGEAVPFILGFAYPPAEAPNWPAGQVPANIDEVDGVVIHYEAFGSNNPFVGTLAGTNDLGRTCVHEVGHYLGLRHVWGDGDCTMDDGIDDTPVMASNSQSMDATFDECSSLDTKDTCPDDNLPDLFENYMDYSAEKCQNMFSKEQVAIMRTMLEGPRVGLLDGLVLSNDDFALSAGMNIYPNPAKDMISIEFNDDLRSLSFELIDVHGRTVMKSNEAQIDISSFPPGLYFVKMSNAEGMRATKSFIKN